MKRIILSSICLISMIIIFSGCTATMHYLNEGISSYPANNSTNVKIYSERVIKDKGVIELGYVSVHITNGDKGDQLKEAVRKEAASIGADAVVDFKIDGLLAGGVAVKYK